MHETELTRRLTAYMAWANDTMLTTAAQLPQAELEAPRAALFGSIVGTFDHILVVAEIFRAHLERRAHGHRARHRAVPLPFPEVAVRLRAIDAHFLGLAQTWDGADLAKVVSFAFVGGGEGAMTQGDILLHLVNHATYHRGFVSTLLYPLGASGAATDYTVFLRDVWPFPGQTAATAQEG